MDKKESTSAPADAKAMTDKKATADEGKTNEIEELKKKCQEYLEGWKRERADFLNYRKDEMEKIGQLIKYAQEGQILKILPILDNFSLAEKNIPEELKKNEHVKGILQISKQIKEFLKAQGIEEIKAIGEKFDPNFHESVGEVPASAEGSGVVKEEVQKGYTILGRVLRPAKVKVIK